SLFPPVESVPQLPPFRRLLVAGVYHASAPIHLALSCLSRRPLEHVILFTPSREAFATTNVEFRDSWIHEHGGDGIVMDALSRIEVM
ncbi:hypothetical protein PUNSTDRAFT_35618, partial [Punctularia strigosozonata HHB-11173 SS5]|uniref:uncharacterized protein n=1 Tax=Punctularia strigosozonata (strain HHB-11173) TaxID=741275 RepID=UPI00044170E7